MSTESQTQKLTLGRSSKQMVSGMTIDGIEARCLIGKSSAIAVSTKGGKIALNLGAFCQVVELPSEMANKDEVIISFKVSPVPGPQ